jgi:preprotein translocase subunit SecG
MFWTDIFINILLVFFVIVCILLILIVLMQKTKQEGLGAAFGSSLTDSALGPRTSEFLIKGTIWLAMAYFILTIGLAHLYAQRNSLSLAKKLETADPVPPAPATPAAPSEAGTTNVPPSSAPLESAVPGPVPAEAPGTPAPEAPATPAIQESQPEGAGKPANP